MAHGGGAGWILVARHALYDIDHRSVREPRAVKHGTPTVGGFAGECGKP